MIETHIGRKVKNFIRKLKQKWGSPNTKRRLWNQEYSNGKFNRTENTGGKWTYELIEKYSNNGNILDLGCGSGNTGNELEVSKYHHYTGVDISDVAILNAIQLSQRMNRTEKNHYCQSDISSYVPRCRYNVIIFRDSIYYIPRLQLRGVLEHYSNFLNDKGVFIAIISDATFFHGTIIHIKSLTEWIDESSAEIDCGVGVCEVRQLVFRMQSALTSSHDVGARA
jgi:SAM-dependent methyltransferase